MPKIGNHLISVGYLWGLSWGCWKPIWGDEVSGEKGMECLFNTVHILVIIYVAVSQVGGM